MGPFLGRRCFARLLKDQASTLAIEGRWGHEGLGATSVCQMPFITGDLALHFI